MTSFTHLIIGGGMAGCSAAVAAAEEDPQASVGILCAEADPPYDRPPLSKDLWKEGSLDDIWRSPEEKGVEVVVNRRAVSLDCISRQVTDDKGEVYDYENLLLATGGTPKMLDFGAEGIVYYRSVDDFRQVHKLAETKKRAVVIGGGFIGAEMAAALADNGIEVTMVFPEKGIQAGVFPPDLSAYITKYYRDQGVAVRPGVKPVAMEMGRDEMSVHLDNGERAESGIVLAGLGTSPETELANQCGLQVEDGILVNKYCRTSNPSVYAAGDVARFHCSLLNQTLRVEHEDNANSMGKAAGLNMAGKSTPYDYLPFFYSDLFDLGYEAIGLTSPKMRTVERWQGDFEKGVVFYLDQEKVRGAVFWNVWDKLDACRELMAQEAPHSEDLLKTWVRENTDVQEDE